MLKLKLNAFAHPQTSKLNKKYIGRIYQKQLLNKVLSCQGRIANFSPHTNKIVMELVEGKLLCTWGIHIKFGQSW